MQTNHQPPLPDWPYWWPHEYDLTLPVTCVCDGTGWLPLPDGETMTACVVCNHEV